MSYSLIRLTEFDNLDRFAASIENTLTKAGKFDEEEAEYLEKFKADSAQFLQSKDHQALVSLLFQAKSELKLDQKYLNSISAITSFLISISPVKDKVLQTFQSCLEGDEHLSISTKLTELGILFNGLDGLPKIQYQLLLHIIEFAQKNERLGVLNSTFADIDTITQHWGLPSKQKRNLLAIIIDSLDKSIKQEFRCQIILKYLTAFGDATKEEEQKLHSYIVLLLKYGQVLAEYGSIFETAGIKYLEKSNLALFQIFSFFITGDVKGFQEFKKSNPNAVSQFGLSEEEYFEKVRVQSISQFAKSGELISYPEFAKNLSITVEEVENWVILAITNKIIDAQIDQFNEIIYIKANYGKCIGKKEWTNMNESLKGIIGKIQSYLQSAEKLS